MDCDQTTEERGPAFADYPPRCACGGRKRPGVVWFGEALPPSALLQAERAAGSCDLFMTLGTSSVVYPAAGLVDLALANNARVLEVNPQATPISGQVHWSIRGKTGEVLPALIAEASASRP
jgi:NAD-dependent deacetylase